jgi:aldehyde dehydrogenase (NAD+)
MSDRCRKSSLLQEKVSEATLQVTSTTSLEDAIDFINSNYTRPSALQANHLATYVFAEPKTAKYLSQFIRSNASFINNIPAALLIGPAAPYFPQQPLSVELRYTPEMFSTCSPQLVQVSEPSAQISHALFGTGSNGKADLSAKQLADLAAQPLKPTGQPLQHARVGFFEQGILIGLGTAATPILLGLGTGLWFGVRFLWQRFH